MVTGMFLLIANRESHPVGKLFREFSPRAGFLFDISIVTYLTSLYSQKILSCSSLSLSFFLVITIRFAVSCDTSCRICHTIRDLNLAK
jgi:hypothetical protein